MKNIPLLLTLCLLATACERESIEEASVSATCKNNDHCLFADKTEIWLSAPNISPETPFTINLKLPEGASINSAKLEGVTMYMGYIPLQFKKGANYWHADTMVGLCSEKVMTWKMTVSYTGADDQTRSLLYYFDSRY